MRYDPMLPIYLQVMRDLEQEMVTGRLNPGDKMPSGRELAVKYEINPNTAQRVYQELEAEGLVETRRGLGTFVVEDAQKLAGLRSQLAADVVRKYLTDMAKLGFSHEEACEYIRRNEDA